MSYHAVATSYFSSIIFGFLVSFTAAQNAYWIYPPAGDPGRDWSQNVAWQVGGTQTLSWYSAMQTASIELHQENFIGGGSEDLGNLATGIVGNTFEWVVNETFYSLTSSPIFYMMLTVTNGAEAFRANSHYFNITNDNVISTSIPLPGAATSAATSHSTASKSTEDDRTTTSASVAWHTTSSTAQTLASAREKKNGLTTGAAVSVAVAVTVLVLGAGAGAAAWFWRRKQQIEVNSAPSYVGEKSAQMYAYEMSVTPAEMGAEQMPTELYDPATK